MSKDNTTILLQLIEEAKKAEDALLVKKGKNLYKNLKKFINTKLKIADMDKKKE